MKSYFLTSFYLLTAGQAIAALIFGIYSAIAFGATGVNAGVILALVGVTLIGNIVVAGLVQTNATVRRIIGLE